MKLKELMGYIEHMKQKENYEEVEFAITIGDKRLKICEVFTGEASDKKDYFIIRIDIPTEEKKFVKAISSVTMEIINKMSEEEKKQGNIH